MYVIRHQDLRGAIDPQRGLVKLSVQNLWRAAAAEGTADWEPGHEIRSDVLGISLFTTGTNELLHYHERTWEVYQVLEGRLRIAVRPFLKTPWEVVSLDVHDMIMLTPGTLHLVDSTCRHVNQVIQAPPALTDKVVVAQQEEIEAAETCGPACAALSSLP